MAINVFVKSGGAQLDEITATTDKVLSGYTYNDSDGEVQTGTMSNKGAINANVNVNEEYSNTDGYYSSIKITGPTLSGNAEASNVLVDKTFYNNSGIKQTGTMINRGAITETIGVDEIYSGLEGYYSSINITGPILTGTATTGVVRSGYTFYSNNGTKQTGTMATKSPSATTVPNGGTVTGEAGYYDAFTIKSAYTVTQDTFSCDGYWRNSGLTVTTHWGAALENPATSFKVTACGGYIWYSRNQGSNSNIYILRVNAT
nr:MAG TPA: tail protein [Caudoviricetes sp.]